MASGSTSKEWFEKSEIDYYSAFLKLWLSFNGFYKRYYQSNASLRNDRQYIEELKNNDNSIRRKFIRLLTIENSNESIEFLFRFSELVRKYDGGKFGNRTILRDDELGVRPQIGGANLQEISFKNFIHNNSYSLSKNAYRQWKDTNPYIRISEKIVIKNDLNEFWKYFLEILYMLRNQLVHGILQPTDENHEVITNCYIILRSLIKDEV